LPLHAGAEAYDCEACGRRFPILFGIPDFRLRSDSYLDLAAERAKAGKLHAYALDHSFRELLDYYYAITDDVPPHLATVYADYALAAPDRGKVILADLPASGRLLDLGCGSGGLVMAAAGGGLQATGVDIALRWLVIAQKRLSTAGLTADLVCASAEALPFRPGGFDAVVAADLIENTSAPEATLAAAAAQLRTGGALWVSSSNRSWLGPHAASRVWAAGLTPRWIRAPLLRRLRGVDSLRFVHLISASKTQAVCRREGLAINVRRPRQTPGDWAARPGLAGLVARVYGRLSRTLGFRELLFAFGPAFELVARKTEKWSRA
jgi:2-polyprenyl-3-methyl-5-hydroxy-6-metoxy-1,4-benzoquinol methylase